MARANRNAAVRLVVMVFVKSAGVVSTSGLMKKMPALFTRTSGTPSSFSTRLTARSTSAGFVTSQAISVRRSAVASDRLRATRTTCIPRLVAHRRRRGRSPGRRPSRAQSSQREAAAVHEPEELIPGLAVVPERPAQRAGHRLRILLLDAAHHHAEVIGLDHHADAERLEHAAERVGD